MFCVNCGTQLADEARICWVCGQPQKRNAQSEPTIWETCEIHWKFLGVGLLSSDGVFVAEAIGLQGKYDAGISKGKAGPLDMPPMFTNPEHVQARDNLIAQLVEDGWEPTGDHGEEWWSQRFRRRVK